jgi:CHAD domain-containing protein
MARTDKSVHPVHPVQALRGAITALEAAVLLCLAKPGKTAVHRLRASTQRIEAQLELLEMLPAIPPHARESQKARRLLKKLRRTAGRVRDFDVQRDLIREEASKAGGNDLRALRAAVRGLRAELGRRREEEAAHLVLLLHKYEARLPGVFEALLNVLAPAESVALGEAQLIALIREWYRRRDGLAPPAEVPKDIEELHGVRKRAKIARYLAESAPPCATAAHRLASRYEVLQQNGGRWHDWLELTKIASDELGESAKLPRRFATRTERALRTFKRHLRYRI